MRWVIATQDDAAATARHCSMCLTILSRAPPRHVPRHDWNQSCIEFERGRVPSVSSSKHLHVHNKFIRMLRCRAKIKNCGILSSAWLFSAAGDLNACVQVQHLGWLCNCVQEGRGSHHSESKNMVTAVSMLHLHNIYPPAARMRST